MSSTHGFRIYFVGAYPTRISGNERLSAKNAGATARRPGGLLADLPSGRTRIGEAFEQ